MNLQYKLTNIKNRSFKKIRAYWREVASKPKRKIAKNPDFPITRLQKFEPANGVPSINKVMTKFDEFRKSVFDDKGKYLLERTYAAKPGKVCKFCEFYDTEHCKWGKIL